jgi:hypothetical protein
VEFPKTKEVRVWTAPHPQAMAGIGGFGMKDPNETLASMWCCGFVASERVE